MYFGYSFANFQNVNDTYTNHSTVSRGDWLGKPANIKVENNGAAVYVGSSLTVQNPLFLFLKNCD